MPNCCFCGGQTDAAHRCPVHGIVPLPVHQSQPRHTIVVRLFVSEQSSAVCVRSDSTGSLQWVALSDLNPPARISFSEHLRGRERPAIQFWEGEVAYYADLQEWWRTEYRRPCLVEVLGTVLGPPS